MSPRRFRRLVRTAATGITGALLAACGGAEPSRLSTGDRTATTGAQRIVLGPGDLPGYEANPTVAIDESATRAASSFQTCAGATVALGDIDTAVVSPGFSKGQSAMVASMALVSPDRASAERALADLGRADVAACLTALFNDVLALDHVPGTTATTERLPSTPISDASVTWRTTINLESPQSFAPVYSDLTVFRNGHTVAALFSVQSGTPFPSGERHRLLKLMVDRMG